jgi:hypothetical protein
MGIDYHPIAKGLDLDEGGHGVGLVEGLEHLGRGVRQSAAARSPTGSDRGDCLISADPRDGVASSFFRKPSNRSASR